MKRKITLLMIAACSALAMNAQVIFTENFTATWTPAAQGWTTVANSNPVGSSTVFQGNGAVIPAFNGAINDYVAMNYQNTSSVTAGDISTWLITPTLNLSNGVILEFAARTVSPIQFADRLQVRMSPVDNIAIPSGTASVGTYTTLMLDINPSLGLLTSSTVVGGVVNGFPDAWAVFTVAVSGLPSPVTGRFAFRYFVQNGGGGANSNYIGIDAVKVTNPCTQPVITVSQTAPGVCSGSTVGLTASSTGTNAATTFTWSSGQTVASVVNTPTTTTTYIVSGTGPGNCVGTQTAIVTVTASPNVSVPSYTVCQNPATTATLTASGATTYSWNTGATTAAIAVTPASTTVYTVTGYASGGVCPNVKTATVTIGAQLSMVISATSNTICSGTTVTLSATSAASTYSWNTGATTPVITVTPGVTTTYSVGGVSGSFPNVCAGGNSITITVAPSPTLTAALSSTPCQGLSFTMTATGATTYTWFNTPTSGFTGNPLVLTAGAAGPRSYTIIGVGTNGCAAGLIFNFTVNPTPTVTAVSSKTAACFNTTVSLTGGGAATYVWSGDITSTSNPATYTTGTTAGTKNFTVTGTTAEGCSASAAVSLIVSPCVGIEENSSNADLASVFPNPFNNEINIKDFSGNVQVYNAIGQLVISQNINNSDNINTSELSKGAYIVKLVNAEGATQRTIKLIKN